MIEFIKYWLLSGLVIVFLLVSQTRLNSKSEDVTEEINRDSQKSNKILLCSVINKISTETSEKSLRVIYPICILSGDSLLDASVLADEYDTASLEKLKDSSLLNAYTEFQIFSSGRLIGQAFVDSVVIRPFYCNSMCVGEGRFTNLNSSIDYEYLGLNGDSSRRKDQKEIKSIADSIIFNFGIDNLVKRVYRGENVPNDYLNDNLFLFKGEYDFDGDNSPELIIGSGIDRDSVTVSLVAVINIRDSIPIMWQLFTRAEEESWGAGHRIIDLLDVDYDGVPEVVIKSGGYESVGYSIFKYSHGTFIEIFSGANYGC